MLFNAENTRNVLDIASTLYSRINIYRTFIETTTIFALQTVFTVKSWVQNTNFYFIHQGNQSVYFICDTVWKLWSIFFTLFSAVKGNITFVRIRNFIETQSFRTKWEISTRQEHYWRKSKWQITIKERKLSNIKKKTSGAQPIND